MQLLPVSPTVNSFQSLLFSRFSNSATAKATPTAQKTSPLVEAVAERGFPASFLGFTPQQESYWMEPGLPFLASCPSTAEVMEAFGVTLGRIYSMQVPIDDQRMAPRFMGGASLVLRPIMRKQDILPGVYVWQREAEGQTVVLMARLKEVRRGKLLLAYDNGGQERTARLRWSDPTFRLFRVIGYNSVPVI